MFRESGHLMGESWVLFRGQQVPQEKPVGAEFQSSSLYFWLLQGGGEVAGVELV